MACTRHAASLRNRSARSTARVLRPQLAQEPRLPSCTEPTTGDKPSGGNPPPRVGSVLRQLRVAECEADAHPVVGTGSVEIPADLQSLRVAAQERRFS